MLSGVAMRSALTVLEKSMQTKGRLRSTLRAVGPGCEIHLASFTGSHCQHLQSLNCFAASTFESPTSDFKPSLHHLSLAFRVRTEAEAAQDASVFSAQNALSFFGLLDF